MVFPFHSSPLRVTGEAPLGSYQDPDKMALIGGLPKKPKKQKTQNKKIQQQQEENPTKNPPPKQNPTRNKMMYWANKTIETQ